MFDSVSVISSNLSAPISALNAWVSNPARGFTASLERRTAAKESELLELFEDCRQSDWDGYGAVPLHRDLFDRVVRLLRKIPSHIDLPELVPEPDGAIALEWWLSKNQVLSLSIDRSEYAPFAWVDGVERGRGVLLARNEFPAKIVSALESIFAFHPLPKLNFEIHT
jgi:hypothetical protein